MSAGLLRQSEKARQPIMSRGANSGLNSRNLFIGTLRLGASMGGMNGLAQHSGCVALSFQNHVCGPILALCSAKATDKRTNKQTPSIHPSSQPAIGISCKKVTTTGRQANRQAKTLLNQSSRCTTRAPRWPFRECWMRCCFVCLSVCLSVAPYGSLLSVSCSSLSE